MDRTEPVIDLDLARMVLASQPFSALLGARLKSFGTDHATLQLDVRKELTQQHGYVHGGVVSYLVDNAVTFAAGTALGADLVTAGFTIDYLRPASGVRLEADAAIVRAGAGSAVVRCDVHSIDAAGVLTWCAVGQGRVSVRPERELADGP
jgi:uncharacterized protein (TIGR00369 family)